MLGKTIYKRVHPKMTINISLPDAKGLYLIKAMVNDEMVVQKLIIQ